MVAGHLQEKKGLYYIVLSYLDEFETRKTKWIPTGLPTKGNKKRAEAMLVEQRRTFEENKEVAQKGGNVARAARVQLEETTGKSVVTSKNAKSLKSLPPKA